MQIFTETRGTFHLFKKKNKLEKIKTIISKSISKNNNDLLKLNRFKVESFKI